MIEDIKPQSDTSIPRLRADDIHQRILIVRGFRVMLDADLAELYDIPTKVFNQAIQRNMDRFPEDFMFQLTEAEFAGLRSQLVTSKKGRGGRRYLPYVFTEQDVAMLSGVLSALRVPLFPTTDRPGGMVQPYAMAGVSFYITDVSIQLDGMGGTPTR